MVVEAVKTHASPVEIWAIVIVAVSCLGFWLSMVMRANHEQVKASGLTPGLPRQLALGEVSAEQAARELPDGFEMPAQRVATAEAPAEPISADAPTRPDLPVQTGEPAPGVPAQGTPSQGMPTQGMPAQGMPAEGMPAQRSGEGDRAERSGAADRDRP
jgi:hypothetical protein